MYDQLTDPELVKITLEGQHLAFEELVNRYQQPIYRYCYRLLNFNPNDAEDATSESLFKAFKSLATYKSEYKFSSWLYRIAHNCAVNIIKDKSKMFFVDIESFWGVQAEEKEVLPLERYELEKILGKLKINDRNILTLFYLEDKTIKDISDILKLAENTVAQKISRARARARKIADDFK
jgi:RNA polymerase sigma factor (sigma-70 family)